MQEKHGLSVKVADITDKVAGMSGTEGRELCEMTQSEAEAQEKEEKTSRSSQAATEKSLQSKTKGGKSGFGDNMCGGDCLGAQEAAPLSGI